MKPLFVVTKKYHIDILNLYLPNSKYIFIKNLQFKTQKDKFEFCNHNFYMIFTANHFKDVEIAVKQEEIGHVHYLKSIIMRLGLSESDCVIPSPILPVNVEKNLTKKINKTHLNLNNFIIIAPEALTCEELPKSFWKQLAIDLKSRGYEIFVNITNKKNFIQGCKTCTISYSELYLLCEKAKAIISLRSGLSEFVLPTGIPNISIYTKFRKRKPELAFPVEKGIVGFSMIKIPFVNQEKIVELNAEKYATIDELKEITIKSFENTLNRKECLV
jgi:hypothetical protein